MRTEKQIDAIINRIIQAEEDGNGNRWPGMTYEQGVRNALDWVTEDSDDNPYED